MVETTPNPLYLQVVATAPTEVQSAVALLEKSLFVKAGELLDRVTIAAKDSSGKVNWVVLDPIYHSILVKTAVAIVKANSSNHSMASTKEALFVFLLGIINGKPQSGFFASKEAENKSNRAKHERKQLACKQSRAANTEGDTFPPPPPPPPHSHISNSSPPHKETTLTLDEEDNEQLLNHSTDKPQGEERHQCADSDSESPDSFSQNFLRLVQEIRKQENRPPTATDQAYTATTSPTDRRASQEAHSQEMKRTLNDEFKPAKVATTRTQARKLKMQNPSTRATRTSTRPGT